jgi:hypothetical protein
MSTHTHTHACRVSGTAIFSTIISTVLAASAEMDPEAKRFNRYLESTF